MDKDANMAITPEVNKTPVVVTPEIVETSTNGTYVHRFRKPFQYEEKTYETINFYFDRLTGRDMEAAEKELQHAGNIPIAPEFSKTLQACLAARAAGIGADVVRSMPLGDYNAITNEVRNFLAGTDS